MFSIAAINDTDSKDQWEPLAPTKEAQEFRLSQIYQEGLLKLQAKEYEKARELLENVLKDNLLPNGQVDNSGSDGHLLQLRFLTLKNLATVFLQQGADHYESALHCYLQAVEIDSKDSVVWNQLGTLSCSMGLLSISRWAFEQGLLCSPNNWNCMEKLLEVLIAIGDEVACLSVAELILRHWPSHSRAIKVKHVIEDSEPVPFAPRGIDRLEPQHVRLKFLDKRKATNLDLNDNGSTKRTNHNAIVDLPEASWTALAGELLKILIPMNDSNKSGDFRVVIRMPGNSDNPRKENKAVDGSLISANTESNLNEEQHQERRSSRLERLRSRKPEKDESDFTPSKDLVKLVPQFLEPFVMVDSGITDSRMDSEVTICNYESESIDVARFVNETSKNHGAYHVAGMLLEEIACRGIPYQDTFNKFLELEELTRNLGENRTPECSLFLAELAYDFGIRSLDSLTCSDYMLKASYYLCKLIESVALNDVCHLEDVSAIGSLLDKKRAFWVRFFWVSGKMSIFNGDKEKSRKEFGVSLALFKNTEKEKNNNLVSISLPHLKAMKELTADLVLHEINLLEVDFLMKNSVNEMMEKGFYLECVNLLAPLLFTMKDDHVSGSSFVKDGEVVVDSAKLAALNVVAKSCERLKPMDVNVYLRCHKQKLRMIMAIAGVEECFGTKKQCNETDLSKNSSTFLHPLLSEEVKAMSKCTLETKNSTSPCGSINGSVIPIKIIGDIQSLLVAVMYHIANSCLSKRSLELDDSDDNERRQKSCFVDAAVAFFRLQHLNPNIPIKTQIELIIAIHEMLAEYGICCASGDGEEDGTFLKLAIKHLLHLDMKLKSINKGSESTQCDEQVSQEGYAKISGNDSNESELNNQLTEEEKEDLEIEIDTALDQCFFCLYGLHLRSDSSYEDDLAMHKNTSCGDYQTKEQCADVFQYILPYANASSRTGLVKLRRVLRAIRKHFPQPPDSALEGNAIEKFLDDPSLCEDKLSEEAGSDGFQDVIMNVIYQDGSVLKQQPTTIESSEPYMDVYRNLYYLLAQSEEMSATDKWAGFVLTKEGEEFVQQTAMLFKYDLLFNPQRLESWQRLATLYDEEVDLLLNDGSKQINVSGWRKNASFAHRVDTSRRRSRRSLLMTLALAKTPVQQGEIHELLALVYYDGLQNVVPIYDQRLHLPLKDAEWTRFCHNSMRHFEKAFKQNEDWSYVYYMGKLSEKLKYSREKSFAYYDKSIALNPSAVDPFYRMHASRLKLLWSCAHTDKNALKIAATYCFSQATKETVMNNLDKPDPENTSNDLGDMWHMLYNDCLSALQICVEGDLKHFHKARYMLAQGLYRKGESGDLEKAKDELSFCFKSSRSSFTINMWEIDSTVKKGRRKTPGIAGNRRVLEVNLPESSRKFITCIRKYILFYMKLLEETGDVSTLERAYISIRADKRFSLCLEDLVPIALGWYIKALASSINQIEIDTNIDNIALEPLLEKMFSLYIEQMNLWSDICTLPEIKCPELSETSLFGYLFKCIQILEKNCKLEALEGINEKIRKRLKNPKLSNTNCAKVHKHVSMAWCRCLVISMASITPLNSRFSTEPQLPTSDPGPTTNQLLCIDILTDQLWQSTFEDTNHLKLLETKWNPLLLKVKDIVFKRPLEENLEAATVLLRSAYNFYRESSCAVSPSCLNLYAVPCQLLTEGHIESNLYAVDILEMNTQKKLLLWAYTLLHGRCVTNVSVIIKYCEETVKSKMKKGGGTGSSSIPTTPTMHSVVTSQIGVGKDMVGNSGGKETTTVTNVDPTSLPESKNSEIVPCKLDMGTNCDEGSVSLNETEAVPPGSSVGSGPNVGESRSFSSVLVPCNSADTKMTDSEEPRGP